MWTARSLLAKCCGALWILSLCFSPPARGDDGFDSAGPLHSAYPLTLAPGAGEDFLGPFYSSENRDDGRDWGVHPLFSYATNSAIDSEEWDFLYPLMTYHRFGAQSQWQLLELFSLAGARDSHDTNASRLTIFPFYFQQRSQDTNLDYTAVTPFYGTLQNRLFFDEIHFVMFPAYAETRKKDVVTENYLMPLFHLRHGDALSGWQFWPLVGDEVKGVTYHTNSFGTVETDGAYKKFFAAWPLVFEEKTGIGTTNWQDLHVFLPFYLVIRSRDHDTSVYLWPFFTDIDNRGLRYHERGFIWPLFTFARGEGKNTTRIFPLFSRAQNAEQLSEFYLWPLYKYNRTHAPDLDRRQTRILFYLYSDLSQKNLSTDQTFRRVDFWPLYSWRHDLDGRERLQVLSLIDPLLPGNRGIEKNYTPLYALWRSEKNVKTGAASQSLLWNLYRRETTPKSKKCSLLFGLFQYEMGAQGGSWRLFYLPRFKTNPSSRPDATRPVKP